ncbi:MAG: Nramp family divalent metal transporter, partial [Planctomycetaceae bacterium]|nr:Nramp family divalent metal transporter [Planctomycetaceae bacterium]
WTYFTAAALMSACGIAMHAMLPWGDATSDKITYGIAHSLFAVLLVEVGGFKLFERVMSACIGVMFVTVAVTAVLVRPAWAEIAQGLLIPRIPDFAGDGLSWTIALMGGVGGTLTVLCYGYWIREAGRDSPAAISICRVDLTVGYVMTALFGIGMVMIGSRISVEGRPAQLLVALADQLEGQLGSAARWAFLVGAWGAVFSSLFGVWQSVPYLFADLISMRAGGAAEGNRITINAKGPAYRGYLYAMALVPILGIFRSFDAAQKAYAVFGAMFIPLLAVALLVMNGSPRLIGSDHRNGPLCTLVLIAAIGLFLASGYLETMKSIGG